MCLQSDQSAVRTLQTPDCRRRPGLAPMFLSPVAYVSVSEYAKVIIFCCLSPHLLQRHLTHM